MRYGQRSAICIVIGVFFCSLAGCGLPWDKWDLLFLQSPGAPQKTPGDLGYSFEDVHISTWHDNQLDAWFVPAASGKAVSNFLVHTGMRGNISRYLSIVPWAVENDFNILLYDWEGFGASTGEADFTNFEPDMHAAVDYLLSRPEGELGIIQLGASFGTVPSMAAAVDYPDQTIGLVLYGASRNEEMTTSWMDDRFGALLVPLGRFADGLWNSLLPDFFQADRYFGAIDVPVLQVIPQDDTIVAPEAQQRFYQHLRQPKSLYITYGNHVHAPEIDPNLGPTVVSWAKSLPVVQARVQASQ